MNGFTKTEVYTCIFAQKRSSVNGAYSYVPMCRGVGVCGGLEISQKINKRRVGIREGE